jgi:hypothetical protein
MGCVLGPDGGVRFGIESQPNATDDGSKSNVGGVISSRSKVNKFEGRFHDIIGEGTSEYVIFENRINQIISIEYLV